MNYLQAAEGKEIRGWSNPNPKGKRPAPPKPQPKAK